ncbi:MAG: class A beta-lactamase, subclass A2 [Pyrinomonadaceae bacterium]
MIGTTGVASLSVLLVFSAGCSRKAASAPAAGTQSRAAPPQPLQEEITDIAAPAKGRVGVSAVLLETAKPIASLNPQDHFPMQSVYKLPISMAVMKKVDDGKLKLEQKVRIAKKDYVGRAAHSPIRDRYPNGTELSVNDLLRFALSESDGTASDILMKLAGGHAAVQAYLTELGIKDVIVLDTEKSFTEDHSLQYRNFATPDAAVSLLRALYEHRRLSESSQALLLKFLAESTTGPNRLKGLLPPGTIVAHKTGTAATQDGVTAATNDIGIITLPNGKHLAIAVFVSDSPAGEATREATIAKIAKAVWDLASK